jgi:hypothetical protein
LRLDAIFDRDGDAGWVHGGISNDRGAHAAG